MTNLRVIRSGPRENAGDYAYEEIQYRRSSPREYEDNVISKLVSNAVIHALEALLTAILSPITMWQWLSKHDHFMIILRVVIEVLLELIMLIVFAGVSILTAAALVFDEVCNDNITNTTKISTEKEIINEITEKAKEKPSSSPRRSIPTLIK